MTNLPAARTAVHAILMFCLFVLGAHRAHAQIAITSINLDTTTAVTGTTYAALRATDANGSNVTRTTNYTYTFGSASGFTDNAKKLVAFTAGNNAYTYNVGIPLTIKVRRVENAAMTSYRSAHSIGASVPTPTPRDLAYFEGSHDSATGTIRIKSPYIPRMEDLFATNDVTIGIDNLFSNSPATNFNNIERIDVIAAGGIAVPVPSAQGFALFERGVYDAHDPAKVALILSLDGTGNPLTYSTTVKQINTADYMYSGQTENPYQPANAGNGNFIILRRDSVTGKLQASDLIGAGQGIGGAFLKYSDFGIAANTTVYGYSVMANDFSGTGANVLDYANSTYYPTNSASTTGIAGNDMATVTGIVKLLSISGNVYHDADGLTNGAVDGTAIYNPSATQLYVNLADASNTVVGAATVQTDGSFSFNQLAFGPLTAQLSKTQGVVGSTAPSIILPSGWDNTGEAYGLNNKGGTGNELSATADGSVRVEIDDINITGIKFGIERLPTADPKTVLGQLNPGGTSTVAVPTLTGTDPEDGTYTGISNTNKIKIITVPSNGILYYSGASVTAGQVIANYDPTKLRLDPNNGLITVTFTYSEMDAAALSSPPATVTIPFTTVLPVGLVNFDARKNNEAGILTWTTSSEQNSSYFGVERSADGRNFSRIGKINAAGSSSTLRNYSFTDMNPLKGGNYYRLQMTDADGYGKLSVVRVLNFGDKYQILLTPNPAAAQTVLSGADAGMKVNIFNAEGRKLASYNAGSGSLVIPLNNFAAGIYTVQVTDEKGNAVSVQQLIKK